jgi:hypothetical protein
MEMRSRTGLSGVKVVGLGQVYFVLGWTTREVQMQKFSRIAAVAALFLCVPASAVLAQSTPTTATPDPGAGSAPAPATAPAAAGDYDTCDHNHDHNHSRDDHAYHHDRARARGKEKEVHPDDPAAGDRQVDRQRHGAFALSQVGAERVSAVHSVREIAETGEQRCGVGKGALASCPPCDDAGGHAELVIARPFGVRLT